MTITGRAEAFYDDPPFGFGSHVAIFKTFGDAESYWRAVVLADYARCLGESFVAAAPAGSARVTMNRSWQPRTGTDQAVGFLVGIHYRKPRARTIYHGVVWIQVGRAVARIEGVATVACTCSEEAAVIVARHLLDRHT